MRKRTNLELQSKSWDRSMKIEYCRDGVDYEIKIEVSGTKSALEFQMKDRDDLGELIGFLQNIYQDTAIK